VADATGTAFAVRQSVSIEAPIEKVFHLLTDREQIVRWMPVTVFEPEVGGRFEMLVGEHHAAGEVTELDPPRVVAYTWDWLNAPIGARTEVRFELEESDGATVVNLIHTGLPAEQARDSHAHGWAHYAERLKIVAEGGDPGPDTMGQD